eukprot:12642-Pelagococcus_subviridis.AAC.5
MAHARHLTYIPTAQVAIDPYEAVKHMIHALYVAHVPVGYVDIRDVVESPSRALIDRLSHTDNPGC